MWILFLLTAFGLKIALIVLISLILFNISNDDHYKLDFFVCGWLLSYIAEIFIMLLASAFGLLTQSVLFFMLGLSVLAMLIYYRSHKKKSLRINTECQNTMYDSGNIFITILIIIIAYVFIRSFIYYDSTPDAETYGIVRILLFSQKKTLLLKMNTRATNIFSNEWNGELNAVFYRVLSGYNQAISFANAENYLYGSISIIWCCKKLVTSKSGQMKSALLVLTMPVVLFLSFACKGDVLPMFLLPVFCVSVLSVVKNGQCKNTGKTREGIIPILFMAGSGSLCAGSKITMIPCIGLISVFVIIYYLHKRKGLFLLLTTSFLAYSIGCFRYIYNFFVYGNLFERVDVENEKLNFSLFRLKESIGLLIKDLLENDNIFTHKGTMWGLSTDCGMLGPLILSSAVIISIVLVTQRIKDKTFLKDSIGPIILFVGLGFSFLFTLSTTQYRSWSFRYYAPYIITVFLFICGFLSHVLKKKSVIISITNFIAIVCAFSTVSLLPIEGELTGASMEDMVKKNDLERQYSLHWWLLENPEGESDIYDFYDLISTGKRILVANNNDQIISFLFGINNSNDINFVYPDELENKSYSEWDAIAVWNGVNTDFLQEQGFVLYQPINLNLNIYINPMCFQ